MRIVIAPLAHEHAEGMVAALGHPAVARFLTGPDVTTVDALHARIGKLALGPRDPHERWLNFAILLEGIVIGRLEASLYDDSTWSEIAYLVGPAYQRQGYAREAVCWLLDHIACETWVAIHPANARSIALVEALGFTHRETPPARPLGSYDPGDVVLSGGTKPRRAGAP
jgi:RimJ/RimL family protein N-acetyltransferase